MNDYLPLQIAIAFILDIMIGDPRWLPHPVRIIGRCIEYLEKVLRSVFVSERMAGIFLTGIIVMGSYLITFKIISFFYGFGTIFILEMCFRMIFLKEL